MTANSPRVTDDLLRRALSELAAGPDADALVSDVLRSVDAQAQVNRRPWDSRGWRRAALLVVATALLVTAAIGTTVTLSRPQPTPIPTASPTVESRPMPSALPLSGKQFHVADFVAPFTYRLPVGIDSRLHGHGDLDRVYLTDGSRAGTSGKLEIFPLSGIVHGCGTSSGNGLPTSNIADTPLGFLEALRDSHGVGMGTIREATLGNLQAVQADIYPTRGACDHVTLHESGQGIGYAQYEPGLASPGRLTVAKLNGRSIGVLISAPTEKALRAWMPIAQAYVNGLVFDVNQ